ncbi:hypothetical protein EJ04DRAFT_544502 [Polyplosphaeria fusca]|uniref:RSE1/DDB1/CPSF1 first beta-propeller domain-containing protein n=1 Tax=Polyplosphaeria fusca TaxID=682080 RepID=A0A9P4V108_9PLEO|nr:hypothetical protein EJ04DRAFT_544502 [Polyplosphaeria fusca]
MENQIQHQVLENGEWVSRTVDAYQVMARAQQESDVDMQEPESRHHHHQVPQMGILTRTVFSTPLVKLMLSANIRQKNQNDVLFLTEDSVHLKEVCAYGHLRHVATKSDFNGHILSARVFRIPRKTEVNAEHGKLYERRAVNAQRRSYMSDGADELPHELVLLTLTSRTLMFLWAETTRTGSVRFRTRTTRLPAASVRYEIPGPHVAVDPLCRAIAVGAHEGRLVLYKTKSMDEWREETSAGLSASPIEQERIIAIQGAIMHMEFLSSGHGQADEHHVVLLLVLVHLGQTKLTCFDWDSRYDLSTVTARLERASIERDDRDPSLLIPLQRNSEFLLVCGGHISTYKDVLSGLPKRVTSSVHTKNPALLPGSGRLAPRWVQSQKAFRNPEYMYECFYIAREDGLVLYIETGPDNIRTIESDKWPSPIDTAFTCIDLGPTNLSNPDVLVALGSSSDGHICKVGSWQTEYPSSLSYKAINTFSLISSIPNWAPTVDLAVMKRSDAASRRDKQRDTLFIANGRHPNGAISELRKGLNARIERYSGNMPAFTGLWIIDHGSQRGLFDGRSAIQHYAVLLLTMAPESYIIRISRTETEVGAWEGSAWEEGIWDMTQIPEDSELVDDGILRDEETWSANLISDQLALQVVQSEARVVRRAGLSRVDSITFGRTEPLLAAATRPGSACLVVVVRAESQPVLRSIRISPEGAFGKDTRHVLPADPTCLELLEVYGKLHVFVGLTDGSLRLFTISETGLELVFQDKFHEAAHDWSPMVCESAAVIASSDRVRLVCGMRNGMLLSGMIDSSLATSGLTLLSKALVRMGTTAVRVTASATDTSAAFFACGPDFGLVRCQHTGSQPMIDSIWFTDQEDSAYQQLPVTAVNQVPRCPLPSFGYADKEDAERDLGGFIFAVSGSRLLYAQLDYDIKWSRHDPDPSTIEIGKAVPRSMVTGATPTKLAYLTSLKKTMVATTETKEARPPPHGYRVMRSSLGILEEADEGAKIKTEDGADVTNSWLPRQFGLKNSERVHSIVEWIYIGDKEKKYYFVVLGTGIKEAPGREVGRRIFLKIGKEGIVQQKESTYGEAVRSIAVLSTSYIVMVVGNMLFLEQYSASRFQRVAAKEMPAPGINVTVAAHTSHSFFVYVSTSNDSLVCYSISLHPEEPRTFEQLFSDGKSRASLHHMALTLPTSSTQNFVRPDPSPDRPDKTTLVLVTDKNCNIAGLFHPPTRTHSSATTTLFEATLPRSVTRLARANIRPPWRRTIRPGQTSPLPIPGVLADDIVGSCTDGTIYSFSLLSLPAVRLLKIIQYLIEARRRRQSARKPAAVVSSPRRRGAEMRGMLSSSTGDDNTNEQGDREKERASRLTLRDIDIELRDRGAARQRGMHVDADLIASFFDDEDRDLDALIRENTDGEDVLRLVREVAGEVFDDGDDGVACLPLASYTLLTAPLSDLPCSRISPTTSARYSLGKLLYSLVKRARYKRGQFGAQREHTWLAVLVQCSEDAEWKWRRWAALKRSSSSELISAAARSASSAAESSERGITRGGASGMPKRVMRSMSGTGGGVTMLGRKIVWPGRTGGGVRELAGGDALAPFWWLAVPVPAAAARIRSVTSSSEEASDVTDMLAVGLELGALKIVDCRNETAGQRLAVGVLREEDGGQGEKVEERWELGPDHCARSLSQITRVKARLWRLCVIWLMW